MFELSSRIIMLAFLQRKPVSYPFRSIKSRQYSTIDLSPKEIDEKNSSFKTMKKKTRTISQDIIEYLRKNNPCFDVDSIPKKYLVKTKNPKSLYLSNPEIVDEVAKILKPHLEKCNAKVIECNPGLGLLTSALVKMKIKNLFLHESDPFFYENLDTIFSLGNVKTFNSDMLQVPKFNGATKKLNDTLKYINKTEWEDDCNYQMIAALSNQEFLRYILRNFSNQEGLLSYGRPTMYLFITPATYQKLIAGPHQPWNLYKPLAVLFQIVFNIELLMKVERHAFLPWPNMTATEKNAQSTTFSPKDNPMYLIKVEGKRDVYRTLGQHNVHRVRTLQKFVTHVIGRKKQRVIPTIEQWVPGFGPHLIARNINVYTLFNKLTPDEILEIFCMIHHIPGYEDFDIPDDEKEEKENEERIDTSIDMLMEEEDQELEDEEIPSTR